MITIASLHCYPVKGLRSIDLTRATVLDRGFAYDREWMIVDENHSFITQRQANIMATITTRLTDTHLVLEHESAQPLAIELDHTSGDTYAVKVWKDTCEGVDQGNEAADWLSALLATNGFDRVRLVRFAPSGERPVEPDYLDGDEAHVGFADGYPFLVANTATLAHLNSLLDDAVPMNRFRPNIVLHGLPALDEHRLVSLDVKARGVHMRLPKPCQRCKVTTIDQQTGVVADSREPLKTLVRSLSLDGLIGGFFGQNGIATSGMGTALELGDEVTVTYTPD
ncbi:MAG: MOSC N-terminal beta barrel domain-containing protein [Pseudomonadota bacterium]